MNAEEFFPRLVEAHYASLYRFALSLAKSPADAADLTQHTYLCWATKGHMLRDATKAKTWLFTTLYREFLRIHRRSRRFTSIEALPPDERDLADSAVSAPRQIDAAAVMDALQEVDDVFREALTLFYLQNLSYLEIAAILSVPIGTVTSRIYRGKKQLRALLEQGAIETNTIEFAPLAACA